VRLHRASLVGWGAASLVVAATFGALAQPLVDAIEGNPDIAQAMGAAGASGLDAVLTMSVLLIALLGGGYVVQASAVARTEETTGRLEAALAGARSRWSWLGAQVLVVALGTVVVLGVGAASLALSAAWSTGEPTVEPVVRAVSSYLPAVAVLGAVGVLSFGAAPRLQPLTWLLFAAAALIAYLGDALGLSDTVQNLSPFHWVGSPPQAPTDTTAVVWLSAATIAFVVGAFVGFRRRDVPRG
jgi:ABC-2 type transport system permease protein